MFICGWIDDEPYADGSAPPIVRRSGTHGTATDESVWVRQVLTWCHSDPSDQPPAPVLPAAGPFVGTQDARRRPG